MYSFSMWTSHAGRRQLKQPNTAPCRSGVSSTTCISDTAGRPFFSQKDSGTYPINFPMPYPLCINAFFGADRIILRILVRPPFQRITSPSALYSDKMLAGSGSMRIFHWDDFTDMILWRIDQWWESRTLEF
ncbi:predicted protein [Coccidioides posadasii str. Silveira]|uniref:Predicted protein n=2 Tax=Coccidioides posadasii TaxID=199306 RepID=E9DEF2_COCPS|nr:predicted protein [Coccidioides posadasii str. Silveira]KMM68788.1 hypothetical protein CPAG_05112 [Coccidioides posadasii RMSCC 3488]